ncbi:MAG: RNA polymerase sigma factor [Clostridium sp.]|uniref:RNA polymerase sigma factor n=1 Tax=Clostridium sp. TaxID=1506 RepID=UPI003EE7B45D
MTDFEKIYNDYFNTVYKFVLSLGSSTSVAEEITQETFFKALKNIDKFKNECSIQSWLCQIAKNTLYTQVKKDKKFDSNIDLTLLESEENFEMKVFRNEETVRLHKLIHKLDEPYKEVFYLRMFGELSFAKIAEVFNKTESWARVTYHRAKLKIQGELI